MIRWGMLLAAIVVGLLLVVIPRHGEAERSGRAQERPTPNGPAGVPAATGDDAAAQPDVGSHEARAVKSRFKLFGVCLQQGAPKPGATVLAYRTQSDRQTYFGDPIVAIADEVGRYVFADLAPGHYAVLARSGSMRSARKRLELRQDLELDLAIGTGSAELRVRFVSMAGEVQESMSLRVHDLLNPGKPVRPDGQGLCLLRGRCLGDLCKLKITCAQGYFVQPHRAWAEGQLGPVAYFDVWIESRTEELVVQIGQLARIHGVIQRPAGTAGDVTIEARMAARLQPRVVVPNGRTSYEIRVLPGRPCALFTTIVAGSVDGYGLAKPVVVPNLDPGEVRRVDLTLTPLTGSVHGSVVLESGKPLAGARVRGSVLVPAAIPNAAPFRRECYGVSDALGAFVLIGIPRGELLLDVTVKDHPDIADPGTRTFEGVGDRSINVGAIVAPRGTKLRGQISGLQPGTVAPVVHTAPRLPDGSPDYTRWRSTRSAARGEFVFHRLAPGDYLVYVGGMDDTPVPVRVSPAVAETKVSVPSRNNAGR